MIRLFVFLCLSLPVFAAELSERQYRQLQATQELLTAGSYNDVLDDTAELWTKQEGGLAEALLLQLRAEALQQTDQVAESAQVLEVVLANTSLPPDRRIPVAALLAKTYLMTDNPSKARAVLSSRITADAPDVAPAIKMLVAIAWQTDEGWGESLPWINGALSQESSPPEAWLSMKVAAEYRTEQYRAAAGTLRRLIALRPDNRIWWLQLGGMHQLLNEPEKQLAVYELANMAGLLNESDQKDMARLMIAQGVPAKSVKILKNIPEEDSGELLLIALRSARDLSEAAERMLAQGMSDSRSALLQQALRLFYAEGQCARVVDAFSTLTPSMLGDSRERGSLILLAGSCAMETGQFDDARRFFQQAASMPGVSVQAKRWLDYISALQHEGLG